ELQCAIIIYVCCCESLPIQLEWEGQCYGNGTSVAMVATINSATNQAACALGYRIIRIGSAGRRRGRVGRCERGGDGTCGRRRGAGEGGRDCGRDARRLGKGQQNAVGEAVGLVALELSELLAR